MPVQQLIRRSVDCTVRPPNNLPVVINLSVQFFDRLNQLPFDAIYSIYVLPVRRSFSVFICYFIDWHGRQLGFPPLFSAPNSTRSSSTYRSADPSIPHSVAAAYCICFPRTSATRRSVITVCCLANYSFSRDVSQINGWYAFALSGRYVCPPFKVNDSSNRRSVYIIHGVARRHTVIFVARRFVRASLDNFLFGAHTANKNRFSVCPPIQKCRLTVPPVIFSQCRPASQRSNFCLSSPGVPRAPARIISFLELARLIKIVF